MLIIQYVKIHRWSQKGTSFPKINSKIEINENEDWIYREHCTNIRLKNEDQIEIDNEMMNQLLNDVLTCLWNAKHGQFSVVICAVDTYQLDDVFYHNPKKLVHLHSNEDPIEVYTEVDLDCYSFHLSRSQNNYLHI
jgi:hypothetical protein